MLAALGPAAAWLVAAPAHAQQAEPFHIRNLNPLVAIFGLPAWDTVRPGSRFDATVEIANDYRLSMNNGDLLIFDGETVRTNLAYSRSVGERWSVGVEAPYYRVGGGVLDDVIDGWHSTFGLPDGGRNARPEGALLFMLADPNGPFFRLDSSQSGWGDTQLKVARKVGARNRFVLQASVKLPTGEQAMLAGSGSTDWSLTLLRSQELPARSRPAGYYWGVGVLRAGEPERIDFRAETWIYTAVIGGSWQPWRRTGLKAQLDFSTPFFDSPLEEIGETAIQATAGAWWRAGKRASLELALVEDLEVSTSPDVVVHFAAHWRW
ncbi:MAG TPA: DUF3187 family protein [Gammaproteobacteria bacterium]|nr:DUF3187 family protein [Gammaproteobacteria bacterium]